MSSTELEAELAKMERLHARVRSVLDGMVADWDRKAPVFFGTAADAYPTSPGDVAGWLSYHYIEHVPHAWELATEWQTLQTVNAFNRHDVDAVMALMTDDVVFENTSPAPDGERHAGAAAVRKVWEDLFASTPTARFDGEDAIATGTRAVVRWRYSWDGGHVRDVDVIRVRDGNVAEKLAYVKG